MVRAIRLLASVTLVGAGVAIAVPALGGPAEAASLLARWWPASIVLVIAAHALTFAGRPFPRASSPGVPLGILGGLGVAGLALLLTTTGVLPESVQQLLPAVAVVGAGILLAALEPSRDRRYQTWLTVTAILRRARLSARARDLQLVEVRAVLGQVALDLTGATLHPAGVDVHATVFGGLIVLRVDPGWRITISPSADPSLQVIRQQAETDSSNEGRDTGSARVSVTGLRGRLVVETGTLGGRSRGSSSAADGQN